MTPIIFDTSIWLLACEKIRKESPRKKKTRFKSYGSTECVRGAIFKALLGDNVVIPDVVQREIEARQREGKLKHHDKVLINHLTYIFRSRTVPVLPTREDVIRQDFIFSALGSERKSSQSFLTYSKLSPATLRKIERGSNAARKSFDLKETDPVWITLARELEAVKARCMEDSNTKEACLQYKDLRKRLDACMPFLLPNYEILLCAERIGAQVFTLESDMKTMWLVDSPPRRMPEPQLVMLESSVRKWDIPFTEEACDRILHKEGFRPLTPDERKKYGIFSLG